MLAAFEHMAADVSKRERKQYKTAYMRVYETGEHTLCGSYPPYSLAAMQGNVPEYLRNTQMAARSSDLSSRCSGGRLLPHRFREYLSGRRVGFSREYSSTALPSVDGMHDVIRLHKSAVLAGVVPWDEESSRLQTIRAIPSFHYKPYYDCIAIEVTRSGVRAQRPVRSV